MAGRSPYVIFAELEAPTDRRPEAQRAVQSALEALRWRQFPLVICSNSTRPEVEAIASELGNREPFIVESGGGILIPAGYFPFPIEAAKREGLYDIIRLGLPYEEVVAGLRRAAHASQCPIRGFYDMSMGEVAEVLGTDLEAAGRAKEREYDEPFEPLAGNSISLSPLLKQIEEEGLSWVRGRRFYHARGLHNKGRAAQILAGFYRRLHRQIVTVGIGYGPHDLSLFEQVDVPIMLRPPGKSWTDAILELLQRVDAMAGAKR